jgi:hypothetical protein
LIDWVYFKNQKHTLILKGKKKSVELAINKPTQLGVFVLSYSRLVMDKYISVVDPDRFIDPERSLEHTQFYGDTDSMHVRISSPSEYKRIEPYIKPNELGMLSNNYKPNGKIIEAIYLAPKTYCLVVITKDAKGESLKYVIKSKGIRNKSLCIDHFRAVLAGIELSGFRQEGLKKVGLNNLTKTILIDNEEIQLEIPPFSILTHEMTRKLALTLWDGRVFDDTNFESASVPFGYYLHQ